MNKPLGIEETRKNILFYQERLYFIHAQFYHFQIMYGIGYLLIIATLTSFQSLKLPLKKYFTCANKILNISTLLNSISNMGVEIHQFHMPA